MALQTLTSTATAQEATGSGTSNNGNTTTELNGRNSIPFSFLVAFLALFVAFMAVGLCARRIVYFVRLRLGLPVPVPQRRVHAPKPKKPELWDVFPERAAEGTKWCDLRPLSGWFLRQADSALTTQDAVGRISRELPTGPVDPDYIPRTRGAGVMRIALEPPPLPARSRRIRLSRPHPVRSFREYWRDLFHPTIHPSPSEETEVESLRVAVLVAMPSQEHRWRQKAAMGDRRSTGSSSTDGEIVGEVALGIAEVPWRCSEAVLEVNDSKES